MRKNLKWSTIADSELTKIIDYLLMSWNADVASNFLDILEECTKSICNNPGSYQLIEPVRKIRKCVVTKHNTIFFHEVDNIVEVIRLFDTRQNPDKIKST